jgi:hypothetical protein
MTLDELDNLIEIALTDKAMADLRYDELKRKHDAVIKIGRNAKLFEWEIRKAWDEGRDARNLLAKLATERLRIELTDKLAPREPRQGIGRSILPQYADFASGADREATVAERP